MAAPEDDLNLDEWEANFTRDWQKRIDGYMNFCFIRRENKIFNDRFKNRSINSKCNSSGVVSMIAQSYEDDQSTRGDSDEFEEEESDSDENVNAPTPGVDEAGPSWVGNNSFVCEIEGCNKIMWRYSENETHLMEDHRMCPICGKCYPNHGRGKRALKDHCFSNHKRCEHCLELDFTIFTMQKHLRKLKCKRCYKVFACKTKKKEHFCPRRVGAPLAEDEPNTSICDMCQTRVRDAEFNAHVRKVHRRCAFCWKQFADEQKVKAHITRYHRRCPHCEQFFKQTQIKEHRNGHCKKCYFRFACATKREEHICNPAVIPDAPQMKWNCPICDCEIDGDKNALPSHVRLIHSSCNFCLTPVEDDDHFNVNPCEICHEPFFCVAEAKEHKVCVQNFGPKSPDDESN